MDETDRIQPGPGFPKAITLRDWFAGQALMGILPESMALFNGPGDGPAVVASACYAAADAMLTESRK